MELAYLLVLLGVIFLYFQLILGRICRWSSSWFVRKGAEASYNLSNLVATVALGLMPKEHSAAVWILYLTVLNNSLAAYDRENELLHLWTGVNILLFCLRTVSTIRHAGIHGAAGPVAYALVVAVVMASAYCKIVIACASASKRYSEEVVKYMKRLKASRQNPGQYYYNATTLAGYRYAVTLDPLTTVHDIYLRSLDQEAGGYVVEQRRRKDLCLSFALFRLLFRRYHGLPCDEADLPETCELITRGLLVPQQPAGDGDEDRRVFRVAEVELGFLHDHVHGGYVLWSREHRVCYCIVVFLKAILMYVASPALYLYLATGGADDLRSPPPAAAFFLEASEFIALLSLHLLFDFLQAILYCRSDRWMVSYVCRSHNTQGRQNGFWRMMAFLHKYRLACCNVYWQNRVGQYSLLGETTRRTARGAITTFLRQQTWDWYWDSHCARQSAPARLPRSLRASIALGLRRATDNNGALTLAGVPSLGRDHGLPRGVVRCDPNTHKVQVILKWHIATSYCEMKLRRDGELPQIVGVPCYEVTGTLSRYCAYLVAFRPELLPCPDGYTKDIFRCVLDEVTGLVGDHLPNEDRIDTLDHRRKRVNVPGLTFTLSDGLDLGHLLLQRIQDRYKLWVILQNVWVKLVLSVAPQESLDATSAKHHAKYLAQGGELVTQLWAILSHAGILKQSSWPPPQVHGQGLDRLIDQLIQQYSY